jgi:exodeoxyribonuclease-3
MLSVTTWNVNGIRARQHELMLWLERERPDVVCLQEIKASPEHVPEALRALDGYWGYFHGHKGYSGVALLFSRAAFPRRPRCLHPTFDHETRIVTAQLENIVFASIYVPNGGKDFAAKVRFLDALARFAREARENGQELILCGDLNVAREERDVHPSLRKPDQIGQTPGERTQLERILEHGLVDLSRRFQPDDDDLFTWWAPWRNMRERNIGWRLDYVLASPALSARAQSCQAFREFGTSDHGPVHARFALEPPRVDCPDETLPTTPVAPKQLGLFG